MLTNPSWAESAESAGEGWLCRQTQAQTGQPWLPINSLVYARLGN
jgi:hypothetical protein